MTNYRYIINETGTANGTVSGDTRTDAIQKIALSLTKEGGFIFDRKGYDIQIISVCSICAGDCAEDELDDFEACPRCDRNLQFEEDF
jgi:hypothetical protein